MTFQLLQNTPESFQYSTALWRELNDVGHIPMRKTTTFAAALALAQNSPHIALEIVGTVRQQNYMTVRNIKVLALAQLGRADDAIPVLRSVLEVHDPSLTKQTFSRDVVEGVQTEIVKKGNKEEIQDFGRIEKFLVENGHITEKVKFIVIHCLIEWCLLIWCLFVKTLDELLCTEIVSTSQSSMRVDRGMLAASYSNDGRRRNNYNQQNNNNANYRRPSRPGLTDLY